ncbi:hypothetical protein B0H13DRAFT_2375795 [Mycena leptocephala]|nr:hypothetical protein B0H13DRAFT_2375795 [Mycena leptocephala]
MRTLLKPASLCRGTLEHDLCRQLYQIASVPTVTKTCAEKHRAILINLAIGLGIPLLQIPFRASLYRSSGHRPSQRDLRDTPCRCPLPPLPILIGTSPPSNVVRPLSLFPLYTPLTHLSFFVVLSIKSFYNSRSRFRLLPSASVRAKLNLDRYLRLMALASTDLLLTSPLGIWFSSNFSRVMQRGEREDAEVGNAAVATSKSPLSSSRGATIPVFIRKDTTPKRESFDSFSDMSASYGGVSLLEYDAKKARALAAGEYDGGEELMLGDVSAMLLDYEESDYSSSVPSSDTESVGGEEGRRRSRCYLCTARAWACTSPRRCPRWRTSTDVPMPVVVRDAADIV